MLVSAYSTFVVEIYIAREDTCFQKERFQILNALFLKFLYCCLEFIEPTKLGFADHRSTKPLQVTIVDMQDYRN